MGITTGIDWTDSTINPLIGCQGCELWNPKAGVERCYAGREARRRAGNKGWPARFDEPEFFPGRIEQAIRWPDLTGKERPDKPWLNGYPRLIFLNDLSDTFTEGKDPMEWLYPLVFKMEEAPHVWMFLTKRPRRMREFFSKGGYSLKNFWLGTTVTGPETAGRLDELVKIRRVAPDALLWLSLEPLLGPVDLARYLTREFVAGPPPAFPDCGPSMAAGLNRMIDWVVVGGESGPTARPMHPDWARSVRDACQAVAVPFFFKQWGEFIPKRQITFPLTKETEWGTLGGDGKYWQWTTPWNGNEGREPDNEGETIRQRRHAAGRHSTICPVRGDAGRMRTCPDCAKTVKPHGKPRAMASGFVDQVVTCPECEWVGVISTPVAVTKTSEMKQDEQS